MYFVDVFCSQHPLQMPHLLPDINPMPLPHAHELSVFAVMMSHPYNSTGIDFSTLTIRTNCLVYFLAPPANTLLFVASGSEPHWFPSSLHGGFSYRNIRVDNSVPVCLSPFPSKVVPAELWASISQLMTSILTSSTPVFPLSSSSALCGPGSQAHTPKVGPWKTDVKQAASPFLQCGLSSSCYCQHRLYLWPAFPSQPVCRPYQPRASGIWLLITTSSSVGKAPSTPGLSSGIVTHRTVYFCPLFHSHFSRVIILKAKPSSGPLFPILWEISICFL